MVRSTVSWRLLGALLCFGLWFAACDSGGSDATPTPDPNPEMECTQGEEGCECDAGECGDGLRCFNNICVPDDAQEPEAGEPDPGEPEAGEPNPGEPNPGEPEAGEPDPGPGEPEAGEPDPGPGEPAAEPDPGPGEPEPPMPGAGLSISSDAARSCEVVLVDTQNDISAVSYNGVKGRDMRRGERLAIAFHALEDGAIVAGSVSFGEADLGSLTVMTSRCFDAAGAEIEGAEVTIAQP